MTDKQLEEKKEQFVLDTNSLLERELTENDLDIIFGWIEKLVEEVERECNKGKLKIERGKGSREYRLVCAMCNGDKSELCRFCEGMGSHMITFN